MKKMSALIVSILMAGFLTACGGEADPDGIDTGVVQDRSRGVVVVLEDDGEIDRHGIHKRSLKCQIGERWPDCKR